MAPLLFRALHPRVKEPSWRWSPARSKLKHSPVISCLPWTSSRRNRVRVKLHPVKQETFNTTDHITIDPKGYLREVDSYKVTDFGLYMARGANHPRFGYLESWLLPKLSLRANIFHFREGIEERQHFYIDVAEIDREGEVWTTRDLYVDFVSYTGVSSDVLAIDERSVAFSAGFMSGEERERAMDWTLTAVAGITRYSDVSVK